MSNREYNRVWMKKTRAVRTWQRAIEKGHCPVCTMLLKSSFHFDCPYLDKEDKTTPH